MILYVLQKLEKRTLKLLTWSFPTITFFDNPTTAKGGVALLLRKIKFNNITELDQSTGYDLKNKCNCMHCKIENKWLRLNINNQSVIIGGIYRHPKGNIQHFNDALKNVIKEIKDDTLAIVL